MKKNILYIADPNSIHDIKWMRYFSYDYNCFLIARKQHLSHWNQNNIDEFKYKYNINIIDTISDYSTVYFWKNKSITQILESAIEKYNIQILHILYAEPNALLIHSLPNKYNLNKIITTRGTDILKTIPYFFKTKSFLNLLVSWNYKKAFKKFDSITCTSLAQAQSVIRLTKISVAPNIIRTGVDCISTDEIINDKEILIEYNINKPFVLFPRAMRPLYNHEFAIQAINELPIDIQNSFQFVFVDKNSSNLEYVKKIQGLFNNDPKFIHLPMLKSDVLMKLYKNARATVMTPTSDGSPVSAMESMLMNTITILPRLNYDSDLFNDNTVKFFDLNNSKTLTKLIHESILSLEKPNTYPIIFQLANREVEMNKLKHLYNI